jgi:hypothetical protein
VTIRRRPRRDQPQERLDRSEMADQVDRELAAEIVERVEFERPGLTMPRC